MIFTDLSPVANHLWQSTFFALTAALLTFVLRNYRAAVRYWIWLAASIKFLIPFSLLVIAGTHLPSQRTFSTLPAPLPSGVGQMIQVVSTSFSRWTPAVAPSSAIPQIILAIWIVGVVLGLLFWVRLALQLRSIRRRARRLDLRLPIPAMEASSESRIEPGVFGILNPVLILPAGIAQKLSPEQLDTVITHELCHVRRKDNLTAAIHMLVELIFWFHPLVWWIRARLIAEREQSCDEAVSGDPAIYAEAILNVCKLYAGSPVMCASGVTGADLKRRIRQIMSRGFGRDLSLSARIALLVLAGIVILSPIAAGLLWGQAPATRAFEVTSVKLYAPVAGPWEACNPHSDNTMLRLVGCNLRSLVKRAWGLKDYQLDEDSPGWATDEKYEFIGRTPAPASKSEMMEMLQTALADRFQLRVHWKDHEAPVYLLQTASHGLKLKPAAKTDRCGEYHYPGPGTLSADCATLDDFAEAIQDIVIRDRPVLNRTDADKTNRYQISLNYSPSDEQSNVPSFFDALSEQLGLTLKTARGPVKTLFIDQARRPEPN